MWGLVYKDAGSDPLIGVFVTTHITASKEIPKSIAGASRNICRRDFTSYV